MSRNLLLLSDEALGSLSIGVVVMVVVPSTRFDAA
jgi:hypothetical protein